MIPLRIHRLLIVLFAVSALLALSDDVFHQFGLSKLLSNVLAGVMAGFTVFFLAYEGGRVLVFCGKGLVEAPDRRAKIRAALRDIGIIEERRSRNARLLKDRSDAVTDGGSGQDRRQPSSTSLQELMYVSVVESARFIAITVNSGGMHRAFVSTRLVDSLSHGALRGVLAHEYGHVANRHPIKQATILGLVAGVKVGIGVPFGAAVVLLLAYLFMLREWEFVADAAAVDRAGQDDVFSAFEEYQIIEGGKDMSRLSEFFSGHPSFRRRIVAINRKLALVPNGGG